MNTQAPSEVRKHVAAVHSSGVLNLLERKLFNVLLLNAYDDLPTKREHAIRVLPLTAMVGFNSRNWDALREALRVITCTAVEFNLLGDAGEAERWTVSGLLASATLDNGVCTYSYSPELARQLYNPDVYARISVVVQRHFESSFALSLHENCIRFRSVGSTGWWPLDVFRRLVGATAGLYDEFSELNRRVIRTAVREINKFSDIVIAPEFERAPGRGRVVTAIRFKIQEHPQGSLFSTLPAESEELRSRAAYLELRELGLSDKLALSTVMQDESWALEIARTVKKGTRDGKIRRPGAYAAKLIMEQADVGPSKVEQDLDRQKREKQKVVRVADAAKERDRLVREFEAERRQKAKTQLTPELRESLLQRFVREQKAAGHQLRGYNERSGEIRGVASISFDIFVVQALLGEYTDADLDAWIAQREGR